MKKSLILITLFSLFISAQQAIAFDIYASYECKLEKVKPRRGPTYARTFQLKPADHTHPDRIVYDIVEKGNNYRRIISYNEENEKGILFSPKNFTNPKIYIKSLEQGIKIEVKESRGGSPYAGSFTVRSFYVCI